MTTNMIKTRSGLVDCPHCHGETVCKVTDTSSCAYCLTQSNLWIGNQIVVCSVCKGRGQITIAPNLSTCPHCQGSTLCKHGAGSRGSCANCIPVQYTVASYSSYTEKYYPEKIILVSGIDKASTMCSLCKGLGRIAVPANAQVCRHCNGSTVCQRGIGANISCQSCVTATRGKTKVPMEGPQRTMCSICDGLSFLTD
jgi:DnaJ-class molecular chaperone